MLFLHFPTLLMQLLRTDSGDSMKVSYLQIDSFFTFWGFVLFFFRQFVSFDDMVQNKLSLFYISLNDFVW